MQYKAFISYSHTADDELRAVERRTGHPEPFAASRDANLRGDLPSSAMGSPSSSQSFFGDDLLGPFKLMTQPRDLALQGLDVARLGLGEIRLGSAPLGASTACSLASTSRASA